MLKQVKFPYIGKMLTNVLKNGLLSVSKKPDHDLIFIRHAESEFNTACQEYRVSNKIPYVWKELCNHEGFNQKVLFNTKYVDSPITARGRMDCIKKRNLLRHQEIDCVLVSPQIRALQTCDYLFSERRIPILVEPLLVGPLSSCCDINKSTDYKKLIFPKFNFSATKECQELWYLDYLSKDQQKICYDRFEEKGLITLDQKRAQLVQLLKEGKIKEHPLQYRKRIKRVKNKIAYYKQFFPRLAIYLSAVDYMSTGSPKFYLDVQNCTPYYASLQKILAAPN